MTAVTHRGVRSGGGLMGQAKNRKRLTVAVTIPTIPPRKELLTRALESVHHQTLCPDDIIVIVDEDGDGAGPTRNRAWQLATTDYVAFLDDDDEFMMQHLARCMSVAKATNADVVYPWFELVGWPEATPERPDALAVMHNGRLVHPLGVPFGPEQARHMRRHAFIPITAVVKRSILERVGGCPTPGTPEWPKEDCEDWGLWLRILDADGRFVHLPERTWRCYYSDRGGNTPLTSTAGMPWK